jgi:hypothetical protein
MMWKYGLPRACAVLLLAGYAVACSDAGPSVGLTDEEAAAIGDQIEGAAVGGVIAGVGTGFAGSAGAQPAAPPLTATFSFSFERQCQGGGMIAVDGSMEGTIDFETRSATLNSQATLVATECVTTRGEHTITFTTVEPDHIQKTGEFAVVDSEPSGTFRVEPDHIQKTGEFAVVDSEPSGTFRVFGAIAWEKDNGDSDTCDIDVTTTMSLEGVSRTGSVCGRDVSKTVP